MKTSRFRKIVPVAIPVLTAGIFFLDWLTPLGVVDWVLYFIPLLLSFYAGNRFPPLVLAAVFSVLTTVGFLLSPQGMVPGIARINLLLGLGTLWAAAFLVARVRRSERFQHAILDSLSAHMAILDQAGRIVAVNGAWQRFARENQFPGNNSGVGADYLALCESATGEGGAEALLAAKGIRAVMAGQCAEFQMDYACPSPQGPRWFILRATRFGNGGRIWVVLTHASITERKLAELSLRQSEQRLQLALRAGGFGVFEHTLRDQRMHVSVEFCQIFGLPLQNLIALEEWTARIYPADRGLVFSRVQRLQSDQTPLEMDYRISLPNGNVRWVRAVVAHGMVDRFHGVVRDITGQKQAESELRKLSRAVEQSPASVVITDPKGAIEYVNPKFCALTGYCFEEVRGKNPRVLKSGELPEETYRQLWAKLVAGEVWAGEFHNRKKDGSLYWELASISPIRDESGNVTHFVAVKEDITERKRAHEALEEQFLLRERLAKIAANAPGIIYTFRLRPDGSSCLPYVSPTLEDFFGMPAEGLEEDASALLNLVHPDDRARMHESIAESARTLLSWRMEFRLQHPRKGWFWIEGRSTPEREADGSTLWYGFMSDITERMRVNMALRDSEEKFRQLADNITDAFWICSPDLKILHYISAGYEKIWGRTPESLYAHPRDWVDAVLPEDGEHVHAAFARLAEKESQVDVEYRIARPDGTIRWIHDRGFQIRDAAGHLIRLAGIASDITERKLTVQQLAESEEREAHSRRALAHEHELNQIKSRFVSMVSHEFRTPLSVISMAGSLLGRYFDRMSQPERDTEIAEIQTAVKRMTQMMEDLLVHENILAGKMVCRPAWINLVAFCWELIAETTKHLYPPRAITCHIDPAAREAFLDEKFLRHVLGNLLSNALKYSADGQPVALEVKRVAGNPPTGGATTGMAEHLQLTVRDSGIGIPAADLARLFGTFHRASNVGNRPGTGMGLAIVKQFLDLHQGTIQIQSEEGKGTTVVVCLPIISAAGPAAATPPPPAEIQLVNL